MLRFPYLPEPLSGSVPPSLPPGTRVRWRPLAPVRVIGPAGQSRFFARALLDSGSDETVFALDVAARIGVGLMAETGQTIRWRGQGYSLRFGRVELQFTGEAGSVWRWPATVGFSAAPIRYPLLGQAGCLSYFDTLFRGHDRAVELETNASYPGITT
jgi:hypothetical protein